MKWSRRAFLAQSGIVAAAVAGIGKGATTREPVGPVVDFHVHLFGIGEGGTGCFLSEKQKRHVNYRYLRLLLGLTDEDDTDAAYVERLITQLHSSSLSKVVLLAQDSRYDQAGVQDMEHTSFYVPNDYLLQVCRRYPDLFVPCVSINPRRRDALDELDRCAEQGARILKIHPPTQDVDPADSRFQPFYRRAADHDIIVMVHTGTEHAAEVVGFEFCDPSRLVVALEEGCTVIAAHSGMSDSFDTEDFFPNLVEMVARFPNLYCDSAILASMLRWRNIPRLLDTPEVLERLIHASDFPFPSNALVFWNRLPPGKLLSLLSERNLLERDFRLKQSLGLPAEVFERGARLLRLQ